MEDLIHKSGPMERWRFVSYRGGGQKDEAVEERGEERSTDSRAAGEVAAALRRALDILKRFPEALEAVQAGLGEAPA